MMKPKNPPVESALQRLPIPGALQRRLQRHVDRALRHATVAYPALRIVVKEVCEALAEARLAPDVIVSTLRDAVALHAHDKGFQRASLLTGRDSSTFVAERVRVWAEQSLGLIPDDATRTPGSSMVVEWQRSIGLHPTEREGAELRRARRAQRDELRDSRGA